MSTPNVAAVHKDLGRTFEEAGELDNALECYRTAGQIGPGFGGGES